LRGLGCDLHAFTEKIEVIVFAAMSARKVRVTRDLLQN